MNNITIEGLTPLQQDLADRLWQLQGQDQVEQFLITLPRNLRREAVAVAHMIIAAQLDSYMEVSDAVRDYINSL